MRRSRLRILLTAALLVATRLTGGADAQELPRLSPAATVAQTVGVTRVEITYGRPAVRGRTIWGELVPWNEVWRTGANEATTISFSHDVRVDGRDLAAGRYALFTIPGETEWTVIFNRRSEQWGASDYDPEQDALGILVKPRSTAFRERFEVGFPEVGTDTLLVSMRWAQTEIPFTVQVDLETTAVAKARAFVAAAGPSDGQAVWNWANYLYQQGWNLEEALGWAKTLADQAPMYSTHALKARLLAKTGRFAQATAAARAAVERAAAEADQPAVAADLENLERELAGWAEDATDPG